MSGVIDQFDLDNAGALVVTDDGQNILGIITERDIARGLKQHWRNLVDKPLRELMSEAVVTYDLVKQISQVLALMDQHQISYIPITRDRRLCGMINVLDLVKYRLAEIEREANDLKSYVSGSW